MDAKKHTMTAGAEMAEAMTEVKDAVGEKVEDAMPKMGGALAFSELNSAPLKGGNNKSKRRRHNNSKHNNSKRRGGNNSKHNNSKRRRHNNSKRRGQRGGK